MHDADDEAQKVDGVVEAFHGRERVGHGKESARQENQTKRRQARGALGHGRAAK